MRARQERCLHLADPAVSAVSASSPNIPKLGLPSFGILGLQWKVGGRPLATPNVKDYAGFAQHNANGTADPLIKRSRHSRSCTPALLVRPV